ncbi:MAG: exodeoxyribonuclease III [Phycisphaerales bacterium]|nr:exodeoxyribonuclease III [Phycisphaerales bacterium]
MKIISYNLNGIRAAMKKGFAEWLAEENPDIIALQETKATEDAVDTLPLLKLGYELLWFSAEKKGYSGVAVFTKIKPKQVHYGNQYEQSNSEGRVIRIDFEDFSLVNAYFPSGTSGELRQTYKYQWLDEFYTYINELKKEQPNLVICGDYNICHKAIDIHDPVSNKNSSGFLPEERTWMDKWFDSGLVDVFRVFNQNPNEYSWWSLRAASRERNKGWRIDYISVTEPLKEKLKAAAILQQVKHSDHCPVRVEIGF